MLKFNQVPRIVVRQARVIRRANLRASLHPQEMYWEVVDARGRVVAQAESPIHNLVLKQTWDDLIASYGFKGLTNYAVVGTGTSDPADTQTQLDSEVARTSVVPSGESETVIYVGSGEYEITRIKQFSSSQVGSQNLTEWGWSPEATAGANLAVRELFRDSNGDPVTLTLDSDQSLRLIYKSRIVVSPEPITGVNASFDLQNVGTFNGTLWLSQKKSLAPLAFVDAVARGKTGKHGTTSEGIALYLKKTNLVAAQHGPGDVDYLHGVEVSFTNYTSGDRARTLNETIVDEDQLNVIWYGLVFIYNSQKGPYGNQASSLDGLWFDWGGTLDKDNLHRLIINQFQILSWGP